MLLRIERLSLEEDAQAKRTLNPNVLPGQLRCWERYSRQDSAGVAFSPAVLAAAGDAGIKSCPNTADAPYMFDPLDLNLSAAKSAEAKSIRSEYVASTKPNTAAEEYLLFRKATKQLARC